MIKVGIRPHLAEEVVQAAPVELASVSRQGKFDSNFNILEDNHKDLGISTKFLVSTESHKDEQSMLRLLNGDLSSNERPVNVSGNFKKMHQEANRKKKKKKKVKGKEGPAKTGRKKKVKAKY